MIKTKLLFPDRTLPLMVYEDLTGLSSTDRMSRSPLSVDDLLTWCAENAAFLEESLLQHGAVLFRGFSVKSEEALAKFAAANSPEGLLNYTDGTSPRTKLSAKGVYTSTEYPPDQFISLHNELSYSHRWPSRLYFACRVPAGRGGETPVADSRRIFKGLSSKTADLFLHKGVKYLRYLHGGDGVGLSWMKTFETSDRDLVEQYCKKGEVDHEWTTNGGLRLSQVRPAVAQHPKTGETVWFNQADQFHPTEMDPETRKSLQAVLKDSEWPKNVCFGDNSAIDPEMLTEIREVTRQQTVAFPWRTGDLMVVDNMLASHGRNPFQGPRSILVAMG